MKASELRKQLEELEKVYGDCEVTCDRYDKSEITEVKIDTGEAHQNRTACREIILY